MKSVLFLISCAIASIVNAEYSPAALADEVTDLPGKPDTNFRHFGGYVNVGGNKEMFYNFVEAQNDPENAPVMLWTNGGPGCSGMLGLFTEQGPFRPTADGTLKLNNFSWNKFANIVFIEQPVGVGFSYTGGDEINYGDKQSAEDNYAFVKGFFERFANYADNDFYITSESYGGHYMPTLAKAIVTKGGIDNFKGLAVGNPLTNMPYRNYGQLATLAGHQVLPKPLWDSFLDLGCDMVDAPEYTGKCLEINNKILSLASGFDPYALDFPLCADDSALKSGRHERHTMMTAIHKARTQSWAQSVFSNVYLRGFDESQAVTPIQDNDPSYFPRDYVPCISDYTTDYLNRDDVQNALHVDVSALGANFEWGSCSNIDFSIDDVNTSMAPVWEFLTSNDYGLKLMIYSGDDDTICATAGTQRFLFEMSWQIEKEWAPWEVIENQVGGFHVRFNNPRDKSGTGKLDFVTVHGAGHMVPSTRPEQASELMQRFLNGKL